MKKLLLIWLITIASVASAQKNPKNSVTYDTIVIRVIDGDTIVIAAPYLPAPLKPELAVRIYGIDTPEKGKRAECPLEAKQAVMASDYTNKLIASSSKIEVTLHAWDKFGGRVLGDLLLDGKSLRSMLIKKKLAKEYYGDAKSSWCN